MRVLLDTNIILDFFLEREPFFQQAGEVFEDAVQIACAVARQVDAIVTRNPQDFQTKAISIFTASQLLEHLENGLI